MPKTIRDPETGLRIYPPETHVAWLKPDMKAHQRYEADYFVRGTKVITLGGNFACLRALLEAVDDTFESVAEDAGASVIEHAWGLAPTPQNSLGKPLLDHGLLHPLLPRGLSLVARVEVVREIAPVLPSEHEERVVDAIDNHRNAELPMEWADCGPEQFVYGIGPNDSRHEVKLLDIDPKLIDPSLLESQWQRIHPSY